MDLQSLMVTQLSVLDRVRVCNEALEESEYRVSIAPQCTAGGMLVLFHTDTCTVLDHWYFEYESLQSALDDLAKLQAQYANYIENSLKPMDLVSGNLVASIALQKPG